MRSAPRPRSVISTLRARCHFYLAPTPDGSRVRRESHARFCERLAVKLRRPTHPLYCTRNLKGNFRIGMRTERSRLRRSRTSLQDLLRRIRHLSVREQVNALNAVLRGHYAYCGIAGNFRSQLKVNRAVEHYWQKMLCSRNSAGRITWDTVHQIKQRQLATKAVPSLSGVTSSRSAVNHLLKSVVREICTLRFMGTGGGRPPPVTRGCAVSASLPRSCL